MLDGFSAKQAATSGDEMHTAPPDNLFGVTRVLLV